MNPNEIHITETSGGFHGGYSAGMGDYIIAHAALDPFRAGEGWVLFNKNFYGPEHLDTRDPIRVQHELKRRARQEKLAAKILYELAPRYGCRHCGQHTFDHVDFYHATK